MNPAARRLWRGLLPWLVVIAAAVSILAWRLQLSFDLGLFLPRPDELAQRILLQQLDRGPGSRFILVGLEGGDPAILVAASDALKSALSADPAFVQVQNGLPPDESTAIPAVLSNHRFVLADLDYSEMALRRSLQDRLRDLAFGSGSELLELIAEDPYFTQLDILERLAPIEFTPDRWITTDGQAVLMAETREPATDIAAQQRAVASIRTALATHNPGAPVRMDLTGVGAFGVELQHTIRAEATWRSIAATVMLVLVLALAYRRARPVVLAGLPLGIGLLVGLAAVSLAFDEVHGITFAFGFTLLGVAIDYPLHLFSHARIAAPAATPAATMERIWPTLRIGALSTLMAYLALTVAGSSGLAQLGLFSAAGLVAAVAVTRYGLPRLMNGWHADLVVSGETSEPVQLRVLPAALVLAGSLAVIYAASPDGLWDDRLSSLSPVPEDRLLQDNRLRAALGAPDMRYQLVLHATDLEALLRRNEQMERALADARRRGALEAWQAVTALLPSRELQRERQRRIPEEHELRRRLEDAADGLPFHSRAFDPFLADAEAARTSKLLGAADYQGTPFANWLDAHLFEVDGTWVSLTFLARPDPVVLAELIAEWETRPLLTDVREASDRLLHDFRGATLQAVSVAALLIVGLLFLDRQRPRRILWLVLTVAAALAVTIAIGVLAHQHLTVFHLIGLLLVFGLGLDYALFFSREESAEERACTRHALLACAASTTLAFGVLGTSAMPLLGNLGLTVAAGTIASFLVARAGSSARLRPG